MHEEKINQPRRPSVFKDLRESAGLTQEQLAAKLGKALSTIRRWEAGDEPKMSRSEWITFCEAIGRDFNELPLRLSVPVDSLQV